MTYIFLYNIFLIVLYTFAMSFALIDYFKTKEKLFLAFGVLMGSYLLDNVSVYMTEFLSSFATGYNQSFMVLPLFKTVVLLLNSVCLLIAISIMAESQIKTYHYLIIGILTIWMIGLPFFSESAWMVWLYYLPNQIMLFYLGCYAFFLDRKITHQTNRQLIKSLGILLVLGSICILVEDTFVIFNIDEYSNFLIKMKNRNVCEDVFSIMMAGIVIYQCLSKERQAIPVASVPEANRQNIKKFVQHYQLTDREEDVLILLLDHQNNQQIADELYVSLGTVKTHVHNIYVKLSINKRSQLFEVYEKW